MKIEWLYNLIYGEKDKEISKLKNELDELKKEDSLEEYYNTKYPIQNIVYRRTDKFGTTNIDVRNFIMPNDFNLPKFVGTDDEIAINSFKWIIENIRYVTDKTQYGLDEYWSFPYEVLNTKKDDCESGACLLASILIKNKIPSWKVRVTAGNVTNPFTKKIEGHAYVTYYYQALDKWVVLDWCFLPNLDDFDKRKDYKEETNYLEIWFSFNDKGAWGKEQDIRKQESLKLLNN